MTEKKVVILGAGPAGLMAAHAASMEGHDVRILSKKGRKSKMMGAQYLHAPIPMASDGDVPFLVNYKLTGGTAKEYADKVYGKNYQGTVSPDELASTHVGWDIRNAYDWLWNTYSDYIMDVTYESAGDVAASVELMKADVTISTIPAPLLCAAGHTFAGTTIWSSDTNMGNKIEDNSVVCNASTYTRWYRAAKIQGWETMEWPGDGVKPPINPLWEVTKPTMTNCNCLPHVHRSGRYGKWTKGVLSHDSFYNTIDLLRGNV